ncbi:MAG TPA: methylated-DNA--[protein]-cysteine S-methyltransferase [Polyangiales bacterium]|nr:methylated-DNA--[protein]-cysteine S-methyltransferase [Polyangiales bacterium]
MSSTNEVLWLERVSSPLGPLLALCDGDGLLRALDYADYEPRMQRLLRAPYRPGRVPLAIRAALAAFFAGQPIALDALAIHPRGTPFQQRVWRALREIPSGTTTSYGQLAARLGMPRASRAVGLANGRNPIAIVVPCHRVIGANGTLTGYAGGLARKRWLLEHEGSYREAKG